MSAILAQAESLRARLTQLVDEDATAFDEVSAAYRLPKDTPEQKNARSAAIQAGLKYATSTPMETLACCVEALELCIPTVVKGNPNVVSDAGAAVLAAEAGMRTAAINVRINLNAIKDEAFVADYIERMRLLTTRGEAARAEAWAIARAKLGLPTT